MHESTIADWNCSAATCISTKCCLQTQSYQPVHCKKVCAAPEVMCLSGEVRQHTSMPCTGQCQAIFVKLWQGGSGSDEAGKVHGTAAQRGGALVCLSKSFHPGLSGPCMQLLGTCATSTSSWAYWQRQRDKHRLRSMSRGLVHGQVRVRSHVS